MRDESDNLDGLLDGLIDGALDSYTPQAPRPGLEQRILASVAAAESGPRQSGWNWRPIWGVAATAALMALVAIAVIVRSPRPEVAVFEHHAVAEAHRSPNPIAVHLNPAPRFRAHVAHPHAAVPEVLETIANARPGLTSSLNFAPIDVKPITIAPIEISALN